MEQWNYKMPGQFLEENQLDWNSTIVTAFNCVALENNFSHKSNIEVLVPVKFKNLIETLLFYEKGIIAEKYNIKFTEEDSNKITLEGCELEILNFKERLS